MPDDTFKEFVLDQLGALPEFARQFIVIQKSALG